MSSCRREVAGVASVADERPSDPSLEGEGSLVKYSSKNSKKSTTPKVPIKSHGTVGACSGHRSRLDIESSVWT